MVGDQHLDAARPRSGNTGQARDAIVDSDDETGRTQRREADDLGRQSVSEFKAVGYEKIDAGKSPGTQTTDDERGARGAVGIEIADDEYAPLTVLEDQTNRGLDALEGSDGSQSIERQRQFAAITHAARGVGAAQHRMQTGFSDLTGNGATFDDEFHARIMPSPTTDWPQAGRAMTSASARTSTSSPAS